jgi:hypothetical protein
VDDDRLRVIMICWRRLAVGGSDWLFLGKGGGSAGRSFVFVIFFDELRVFLDAALSFPLDASLGDLLNSEAVERFPFLFLVFLGGDDAALLPLRFVDLEEDGGGWWLIRFGRLLNAVVDVSMLGEGGGRCLLLTIEGLVCSINDECFTRLSTEAAVGLTRTLFLLEKLGS